MKLCPRCQKSKPLDEFTKCAKTRDGAGGYCKLCARESALQWRLKHPERRRAYQKAYNQTESSKVQQRRYRASHRDKLRQLGKAYTARNPERVMWYEARKRAKSDGVPISITWRDIQIPDICPILGIRLRFGAVENNRDACPSLDRLIPERGYVPGNIAVISYRANRIKNDATLDELQRVTRWCEEQISANSSTSFLPNLAAGGSD